MESNGKSVDRRRATRSTWQTGPIVWGQPGTNGQHAYYQLIHQGTKLIPATSSGSSHANHEVGRPPGPAHGQPASRRPRRSRSARRAAEVEAEGVPAHQVPHRVFAGNHPTNTILAPKLTPHVARAADRALRAQGVHPGRDLEHQLVRPVGRRAGQEARRRASCPSCSREHPRSPHDSSTNDLIRRYRRLRSN